MVTKEQRDYIQKGLKKYPELRPLRKKLLSIGGEEIVPREEPDLNKIIKRGKLCDILLSLAEGASNCSFMIHPHPLWFGVRFVGSY